MNHLDHLDDADDHLTLLDNDLFSLDNATMATAGDPRGAPLFLHVFAHVIPHETFRATLPLEQFLRQPLHDRHTNSDTNDRESTVALSRQYDGPCRDIIESAMRYLITDVLNTAAVAQVR
jgi:hypothetical protein